MEKEQHNITRGKQIILQNCLLSLLVASLPDLNLPSSSQIKKAIKINSLLLESLEGKNTTPSLAFPIK